MYQKILVPLDGSELAECVLPYVEELAKGCNVEEVILVSITEPVVGVIRRRSYRTADSAESPQPLVEVPITVGKQQRQAERYLNRIAKRLGAKRLNLHTEVLLGNPAEEIIRYCNEKNCTLIAMASHGRSGISRWAFGSVADKVLRASTVPVLAIKCTEE